MGCPIFSVKPLHLPMTVEVARKGEGLTASARRIGAGLLASAQRIGASLECRAQRIGAGLTASASLVCTVSIERSLFYAADGLFITAAGEFIEITER